MDRYVFRGLNRLEMESVGTTNGTYIKTRRAMIIPMILSLGECSLRSSCIASSHRSTNGRIVALFCLAIVALDKQETQQHFVM